MSDEKFDKIEKSIDSMVTAQQTMNITLTRLTASVEHHVQRSNNHEKAILDIKETKLPPLQKQHDRINFIINAAPWILGICTGLAYLLNAYWK